VAKLTLLPNAYATMVSHYQSVCHAIHAPKVCVRPNLTPSAMLGMLCKLVFFRSKLINNNNNNNNDNGMLDI
jgi:hypothetical protein